MQLLEDIFTLFSHLLEIYGALIIIFSGTFFFTHFLRTSKDGQQVRLNLARHLAFALEFKLGGEIIRTVLVRTVDEIFFLAAIILLRGVLAFLIHWEIREERRLVEEDDA
ncbi:MAG TPA: DUF1622 domain-containing protein [Firmicutes bacterium]|nr:DUF1622 domain-containing protein [Bacillota bacterium]